MGFNCNDVAVITNLMFWHSEVLSKKMYYLYSLQLPCLKNYTKKNEVLESLTIMFRTSSKPEYNSGKEKDEFLFTISEILAIVMVWW